MNVIDRPMPRVHTHNVPFFKAAAEGRFCLQQCSACGDYIYYPRVACPHCLATDGLVWKEVSGLGTIYSFALVHRPQHPAFLPEVPIPLTAVRLDEGPIVISTVVNCPPERLRIDMRVKAVPVQVAPGIGLLRFQPAEEL